MTNEEMERAIDFLLKSQANFEARQQQYEVERAQRDARIDERFELTARQSAETEKKLMMFADLQSDLTRVMTQTIQAQAQINASQKAFNRSVQEFKRTVTTALDHLTESQAQTDRRLDALIDIVQRERDGGKS